MEALFHNDIVRYKDHRYRVSAVTDTEYTITRPLNRGAVEEITIGRDDRRLKSFSITEMELRRYGFEKLKNDADITTSQPTPKSILDLH